MSSRPEIFRREKEQASARSALYRFPSKPYPHSMLMVFKKFDYKAGYVGNGTKGEEGYTAPRYVASGLLRAQADSTGKRTSGVKLREERYVELPFPKQLSDNTSLQINSFNRDPLVEMITNGLSDYLQGGGETANLSALPTAIQKAGADLAAALAGAAGGGGGIGGALKEFGTKLGAAGVDDVAKVTQYLMQKASPLIGEAGNSINLATGQILNPKETLAFEGVQLRSHSFSWDLFPSNLQDSERINNIVNVLKRSVLPRTQDFAAGMERTFLQYPYVCEIYLIGVDAGSFMKFKPSFVTSMSVDYAGGGQLSILKGGKPAGVQLSLNLQELAIETAEDYGEASEEAVFNQEQSTALQAGVEQYVNTAAAAAAADEPGSAGGG